MSNFYNKHMPHVTLSTYTIDWVNRILRNGGSKPSTQTILSVNELLKYFYDNNLLPQIVTMCIHVPDNLIAAITPIYKQTGNDVWTNNNFVSGDLSIHGLLGSATSDKYLNTGINCNTLYGGNPNSAAGFFYSMTAGQAADNGNELGAYDGSSGMIFAIKLLEGGTHSWFFTGAANYGLTMSAGYFCMSRVSAANCNIYFANSTTAHTSLWAPTAGTGTPPNANLWMFSRSGPSYQPTSRRASATGYTYGLTAANSTKLYTGIQLCRQRIGGGFI